jgi:hypothetical protein
MFTALFFVTLQVHSDNLQLMDKALKYFNEGIWIHHGSAGTGVGFVPGSLLTVLTVLPMQIYFSPYSAMAVIGLLHLLAYFLLADPLQKTSPLLATDLLVFFWLNPWRVEQAELYNPGYIFFFAALHFWTSLKMKRPHFWLSFFHVLSIGLCGQIHYSVLILIILSTLLFYYRKISVSWWGILTGVLVTLISLIPYINQYLHNSELNVTLTKSSEFFIGRNLLYVYPVVKAALYWVRYGSSNFGRHIFGEINFLWLANLPNLKIVVEVIFTGFKYAVAVITLLFSFKMNWELWKKQSPKISWKRPACTHPIEMDIELRIYDYAFLLFVAMIVSAGLSPVEFNHWHLILCFPVVAVLLTLYFQQLRQKWPQRRMNWLFSFLIIYFCFYNVFAGLGSRSHSFENNYSRDLQKHYDDRHEPWGAK